MKHEKFVITIEFIVGEGMRPIALEEIKRLKLLVMGNSLADPVVEPIIHHASHHRWNMTHEDYNHSNP